MQIKDPLGRSEVAHISAPGMRFPLAFSPTLKWQQCSHTWPKLSKTTENYQGFFKIINYDCVAIISKIDTFHLPGTFIRTVKKQLKITSGSTWNG